MTGQSSTHGWRQKSIGDRKQMRSWQNWPHFTDDIFKWIFERKSLHLYQTFWCSLFLKVQLTIRQQLVWVWLDEERKINHPRTYTPIGQNVLISELCCSAKLYHLFSVGVFHSEAWLIKGIILIHYQAQAVNEPGFNFLSPCPCRLIVPNRGRGIVR